MVINDGAGKALGGELNAEGVGTAPAPLLSLTPFVLPVFFAEERNVDPPDHHGLPRLDNPGGVDQIPPDDVPGELPGVSQNRPNRPAGGDEDPFEFRNSMPL